MIKILKSSFIWLLALFCVNAYGNTPTINASTTSSDSNVLIVPASHSFLLSIQYDGTNTLSVFILRTYFDSSRLSVSTVTTVLSTGSPNPTGVVVDTSNEDADSNTDARFSYSWSDNNANWPVADAGGLPIELFQVTFNTSQTIFTGNSTINFTSDNSQSSFAATPVFITNTPEILTGNNQTTTVGNSLTSAITLDYGNNVGVSVTFIAPSATFSDTSTSSTTIITDANGMATAPSLTVNTIADDYQITAYSTNFVTITLDYTAQADAVSQTQSVISPATTPSIVLFGSTTFSVSFRDDNGNEVNIINSASISITGNDLSGSELSPIITGGQVEITYTAGDEAGTEAIIIAFDNIIVGTFTIIVETPIISFSLLSSSATENFSPAQLGLSVSPVPATDTILFYSLTDNTTNSDDYGVVPGSLTITAGNTTATIAITITDDNIFESDETFSITLATATNATINPASNTHDYTIVNNEATPSIGFDTPTASGSESISSVQVSLTLSGVSATDTYLFYTISGSATTADYTDNNNGSLTITAGNTTATIAITITDDNIFENDETFSITLATATNATINPASNTHDYTIVNNEATPSIGFDTPTASGSESISSVQVSLTLSGVSATDTYLFYTISGSATTADYTDNNNGSLTITAGNTTATIAITITDDNIFENDETFSITLATATNATINPASNTHDYTIVNNEATPSIGFDTPTASGSESISSVQVSLTLSGVSATDTYLFYTISGSATTADYTDNNNGSLTITAGNTTATIAITITDDNIFENDETFSITLATATNATINPASNTHDYTIVNNEATPSIGFDTPTASGSESISSVQVSLTLSGVSATDTYLFYTISGSATTADYTDNNNGSLTITAGNTTATIAITITDDNIFENDETFSITLATATNATINPASNTHDYTIIDDDNVPVINSSNTISVNENQLSVLTATATDADGDMISFAIVGGVDGASFSITPEGILTFNSTPNFEAPADTINPATNTYVVVISATDTFNNQTTQSITITIINVDEPENIELSTNTITVGNIINATIMIGDNAGVVSVSVSGSATFSAVLVTVDTNIYTVSVSNTIAQAVTLTALVDGVIITTQSITFTVDQVTSTQSQISTPTLVNLTADGQSSPTISINPVDGFGNPIIGANASLSIAGISATGTISQSSEGTYIINITSTQSGTATIEININGIVIDTIMVYFAPGVAVSASSTLVLSSGSTNTTADNTVVFIVQLNDQFGNNTTVLNGATLTTSIPALNSAMWTVGTLNATGLASVTYIPSMVGNDSSLTLSLGNSQIGATVSIVVTVGSFDNILLTADPVTLTQGTTDTVTLIATLRDQFGNTIIGDNSTTVTFMTSSITILAFANNVSTSIISVSGGIATLPFEATNTSIGIATLTAYVGNVGGR